MRLSRSLAQTRTEREVERAKDAHSAALPHAFLPTEALGTLNKRLHETLHEAWDADGSGGGCGGGSREADISQAPGRPRSAKDQRFLRLLQQLMAAKEPVLGDLAPTLARSRIEVCPERDFNLPRGAEEWWGKRRGNERVAGEGAF
jgi:hypothetical protein